MNHYIYKGHGVYNQVIKVHVCKVIKFLLIWLSCKSKKKFTLFDKFCYFNLNNALKNFNLYSVKSISLLVCFIRKLSEKLVTR